MDQFNKLAASLVSSWGYHYPESNQFEYDVNEFFNTSNIDDLTIAVTKLITDLAITNNIAYKARYRLKDCDNAELVKIDDSNKFSNLCEVLKFLRFIHYNCDFEETKDVVTEWGWLQSGSSSSSYDKLRQKIEDLDRIISNNIIRRLPEYKTALFGGGQ